MEAKHIVGLPYAALNASLSLSLAHARVHLSVQAIRHICERHPHDAAFCLQAIEPTIITPDYAGQSPRHPDNFVLIKTLETRTLLVAIRTSVDRLGDYPIQSAYVIDASTVQRRLRKGYFIVL